MTTSNSNSDEKLVTCNNCYKETTKGIACKVPEHLLHYENVHKHVFVCDHCDETVLEQLF